MSITYPFKRTFYYDVQESVIQNQVTFITGVKKCGKTVCMIQLAEELPNAEYHDVKAMSESQADEFLEKILTSIRKNEERIYLLDGIAAFFSPETALSEIAMALSEYDNSKTRFVFAGSQPAALRSWAGLSFSGNAKVITVDFLSYPEWLAYKGISEVSEQTYKSYLLGTMEFYKDFGSLEDYLNGCLEETILANYKSRNVIMNNSCDLLDTSILTNILHTLVSCSEVSEKLRAYNSMDSDVLRQGLIFLHRWGLITLNYVSDKAQDFSQISTAYKELTRNETCLSSKKAFFDKVNICVRHPFFFEKIVRVT